MWSGRGRKSGSSCSRPEASSKESSNSCISGSRWSGGKGVSAEGVEDNFRS